jgi:hypothetical protein
MSGPEEQKGVSPLSSYLDNTSLFLEFQGLSVADGCKSKYCVRVAGSTIKQH